MQNHKNNSYYDLEDRTFEFAKDMRSYVMQIKKSLRNLDDIKQLLRSSGSVGANYIEANESISKKDFVHRIKICRKEAKETRYWLRLMECKDEDSLEKKRLIDEAMQLCKIFGSILEKSK